MKSPVLILVAIASALVAGCGNGPSIASSDDSGDDLTAADLALLMDFHAWNISIPDSQQPVKKFRLVFVKSDGTAIPEFDTGENLGSLPCTSVLLGFRINGGTVEGRFHTRDSNGGGTGWKLNFAEPFADSTTGWGTAGTVAWSGNRATLATVMNTNGAPGGTLALELVK